jgi:hypothetical protein
MDWLSGLSLLAAEFGKSNRNTKASQTLSGSGRLSQSLPVAASQLLLTRHVIHAIQGERESD